MTHEMPPTNILPVNVKEEKERPTEKVENKAPTPSTSSDKEEVETSPKPDPKPTPPRDPNEYLIGQYKVLKVLGKGSFGEGNKHCNFHLFLY